MASRSKPLTLPVTVPFPRHTWRHHRAKTTGRWRYLRTPDGDYQWHGPYGTTFLVTDQRTRRLP